MNFGKNLPSNQFARFVMRGTFMGLRLLEQGTIFTADQRKKILQGNRTLGRDTVTPLLGFTKYYLCDDVVAVKSVKRDANRFRIDYPH